ncbi:MAG: prolipoprotein diacylglyceryl transferase [Planctomycetota bacterium]|nr:MAG: prolipoprotein diacylglyceryl transferase [Planctomycetota bacterium]
MWPEIFSFELFGREFPLRSFGLFVAAGFLIGIWYGTRLSRRFGSDPQHDHEKVPDIAWWLLIGIVGGARLAYVLVNFDYYLDHPLEAFAIWKGGLVMYGGLILAVVLGFWKVRTSRMDPWQTADYGLTAGFLGQGIGRWGCLAVGDDYGSPTDVPWGIRIPDPLPEGSLFPPELVGEVVHPTQLYMSLKAFLLFGLGMWMLHRPRKFKGAVFCVLLAGYSVLRFLIEFVRYDSIARGGIFKAGHRPEDVRLKLQELGVADAAGKIIDPAQYQRYLAEGMEGIHPELLLSTSQLVGLAMLPLAVLLYFYLSRRPNNQYADPKDAMGVRPKT